MKGVYPMSTILGIILLLIAVVVANIVHLV